MKVFVWERVDQATDNYHSEGGVVVFADDVDEARMLANQIVGCNIRDDEYPDEVRSLFGYDGYKKVFIMPDAGCC